MIWVHVGGSCCMFVVCMVVCWVCRMMCKYNLLLRCYSWGWFLCNLPLVFLSGVKMSRGGIPWPVSLTYHYTCLKSKSFSWFNFEYIASLFKDQNFGGLSCTAVGVLWWLVITNYIFICSLTFLTHRPGTILLCPMLADFKEFFSWNSLGHSSKISI